MSYAWVGSVLVPPAILVCDRALSRRKLGLLRGILLSSVMMIVVIVGTALAYDHHLETELAAFDVDGDGVFAGPEVTPEQEQALSRLTNDVSRTFAPLTGGIFAIGYSTLFFAIAAAAG